MKREMKYKIISVISLVSFIFIWELITDLLKLVPSFMLPSPYSVLTAFWAKLYDPNPDGATLLQHIVTSLEIALTGYLCGALVGIPLGIVTAWYKRFDMLFKPVFDLVRPIPPIAWIPIMILWFGIGLPAKAAIIFVSAFIPCVINTEAGIRQTSSIHIWVAKTFGASNFYILRKVAIPTALPLIFTGLRISLGTAWMTLVAAELLASNRGLGYMIQITRMLGRADIIVVGMLTIGSIGALLAYILWLFERKYVKGGN